MTGSSWGIHESMKEEDFITHVANRVEGDARQAEQHVRVTLEALGRMLPEFQAANLAAELPPRLDTWVERAARQRSDQGDLVECVAQIAGLDRETAGSVVYATLSVLRRAVTDRTFTDVQSALPPRAAETVAAAATAR
jgi:uncharacterized protein (DUF2267 family)